MSYLCQQPSSDMFVPLLKSTTSKHEHTFVAVWETLIHWTESNTFLCLASHKVCVRGVFSGTPPVVLFFYSFKVTCTDTNRKLQTTCTVVLHSKLNMEVELTDRATGLSTTPEPNLQCSFDCVHLSRKLTLPTRKRCFLQMSAHKNTQTEWKSIRAVINKWVWFLQMDKHYRDTFSYASLAG